VALNPSALRSQTASRNNLSTARTIFQLDENFQLNENNSFFAREWLTYDPPYSWNSANNYFYSHANPKKPHGTAGTSLKPHSYGHFTNDALNQPFVPRDAWWQSKWGPLTLFLGQQIVVCGASRSRSAWATLSIPLTPPGRLALRTWSNRANRN
jgi:hypothetical protein